jgi:hypothetical protein
MSLLAIKGLKTHFKTDDGWLHAVDGVDLAIDDMLNLTVAVHLEFHLHPLVAVIRFRFR